MRQRGGGGGGSLTMGLPPRAPVVTTETLYTASWCQLEEDGVVVVGQRSVLEIELHPVFFASARAYREALAN